MYKVGDNELPCGTPDSNGNGRPVKFPILILAFLFVKKLLINFIIVRGKSREEILYCNPLCQTLSKALLTSRNIKQHWLFLEM